MRLAAIALSLGAAALAVPLVGPGQAPDLDEDRHPAAIASAGAALPDGGLSLGIAERLEAARHRLAAAQATEPSGYAKALRELEAALVELQAGTIKADDDVRAMRHAVRSEDAELKRLLASLVSASLARVDSVPPVHPAGPIAAARAAALLPASEAALRAGAGETGIRLAAIFDAERQREASREALAAGLKTAGEARGALRGTLLAAAESPPPGPPGPGEPFTTVARDSDTLTELAGRLAGPVPREVEQAAELTLAAAAELAATDALVTQSSRNLPGSDPALFLEMPVTGRILGGFRAPDGAGVLRPGLTLAAAPRSLVTAPATGEVRYVGPFLDWNRVVAVAPAANTIVLLAGLNEVAVKPGDVVEAGAPVGFLGGREIDAQEFLMLPEQGNDTSGAQTLYMEVWRAGKPVDPEPWLVSWTDLRSE